MLFTGLPRQNRQMILSDRSAEKKRFYNLLYYLSLTGWRLIRLTLLNPVVPCRVVYPRRKFLLAETAAK
jgi:hypothetical protein